MKSFLKFLTFEGVAYIIGALSGIVIARYYGVEFRGILAEYRLYGGIIFALFLSGFKLNVLSKFDKYNYLMILNLNFYSLLFLGLVLFIPLLLVGTYYDYKVFLIVAVVFQAFIFCIVDFNHAIITSMKKIKYAIIILIIPSLIYLLSIYFYSFWLKDYPIIVYLMPFVLQLSIISFLAVKRKFLVFPEFKNIKLNLISSFSYIPYYGTLAVVSYLPGLFLVSNTKELAFFSVAHSLTIPLLKIPRIVGNFSFMNFKESKEKIFNKLLLSTFILISFSAIFFFFISDFLIVFLFSNEFYDSSLPFKILIFSLPLTVLISRMESKFFTENLKKSSVLIVVISLIAFLPLFFIDNLNSVAISICFSFYRLIMALLFLAFSFKYFKLKHIF